MADKPILFSAPMVRALLDGRKMQTRLRLDSWCDYPPAFVDDGVISAFDENDKQYRWPRAHAVGDRLWVREAYYQRGHWEPVPGRQTKGGRQKWAFTPADNVICFDVPDGESVRLGRYHKDPSTIAWHKRLARFMPKSASRLTLIVTDVKVERLRDISEEDARAEGFQGNAGGPWGCEELIEDFSDLWDSIHGPDSWEDDPWVAAYSFRVIKANIDQIGGEA